MSIGTLGELNRLLGADLKRAGHSRYSESTKKLFSKFQSNYKSEFSAEALETLKDYHQQLNPLLLNINRSAKNEHIQDMVSRLQSEVDRLIHMQEKNLSGKHTGNITDVH